MIAVMLLGSPQRYDKATYDSWSDSRSMRSEEHTAELQSPCNLVCRLLLENKSICGAIGEAGTENSNLAPLVTSMHGLNQTFSSRSRVTAGLSAIGLLTGTTTCGATLAARR